MKSKKVKLVPPDKKRCQAMIMTGCFPCGTNFMAIGPGKLSQCDKKPEFIATERRKNKEDGQKGSMSLCASCLAEFLNRFGPNHATIEAIK